MKTQRCTEERPRGSALQGNARYHSEESVDTQVLARLRQNNHSNQSHYLSKHFKQKFRSIELCEHAPSVPPSPLADAPQLPKAKDVTLPHIALRNGNDCYKILLRKGAAKGSNLVLPHQNKKGKFTKAKSEGEEDRPKVYSYLTNLGGRVKNEDRVAIQTITTPHRTYQYFAVFDGHGGYLTSNYLSLHLHLVLQSFLSEERPPGQALRLSLALLQEKLRKNPRISSKSGSCALVCLTAGDFCWVANVGDSRLLAVGEQGVSQVTRDHKPEDHTEKIRIVSNGGDVYRKVPEEGEGPSRDVPYRVYPGKLSVSRTIGDVHIKRQNSKVVIAQPDLFTLELKGLSYLILLTDGVYEKLSNLDIAGCFRGGVHPEEGVREVFQLAEARNSEDNRSIVAIKIK